MAGCIHKTLTKVSSDIDKLYDATLMQISIRSKHAADLRKQRADTNLAAIMNLMKVQITLEQDAEILAVLEEQKTNLLEIIKKKTEKQAKFKIAENKAVSKLQNQFSNLEKSVDEKFAVILKSIENGQSAVNSWAQIASQNAQKEQKQQDTISVTKSTQKQT